eukprot:TRINITY_DN1602_c0_g1_i3.p1 TRINITY_DN1602_c0_g1~~TRINITY_DN1602_c0_g1_i3.p1  ORF type:complete len:406 (-),score=87.64 TRINITY_DN1602_c0_g1_i3:149-1366(-)
MDKSTLLGDTSRHAGQVGWNFLPLVFPNVKYVHVCKVVGAEAVVSTQSTGGEVVGGDGGGGGGGRSEGGDKRGYEVLVPAPAPVPQHAEFFMFPLQIMPYSLAHMVPSRTATAAVILGNNLVFIGGDQGNPYGGKIENIQSDLWYLELDSRQWVHMVNGVAATELTAVVAADGMVAYVFGGNIGIGFSNSMTVIHSNMVVSPMQVLGDAPPARSAHSAVTYNNTMYVFGGWNGTANFNDVWAFSFPQGPWRCVVTTGDKPSPRRTHKAAVWRNYMYVFGGYDGASPQRSFNELFRLDLDTHEWSKLSVCGDIPIGRARCSLTVHPSYPLLYMIGGWDRTNHFADVYVFDIGKNEWKEIPSNLAGMTGGIAQQCALVHDSKLLLCCGYHHNKRQPTNITLGLSLKY